MAKRKAPAAGSVGGSSSAKKSKAEQLAAAKKWADEKKSTTAATTNPNPARNGAAIATNQPGCSASKSRAAASSSETNHRTEGGKGGSSFLKSARENGHRQAAGNVTGGSSKKSVSKPNMKTEEGNKNGEGSEQKKGPDRNVAVSKVKYILSLLILLAINVGAVCFIHLQQSQLGHFRSQCDAELEKLHMQLKQREEARSVIETGTEHVLNKDKLKEGTSEQIKYASKVYGLMVTKMDELSNQEKAEWMNTVHTLEDLYMRSRTELGQHRDPLMKVSDLRQASQP